MEVSTFKTSAWQSSERADAYHESTVSAHKLFQVIRHDLFLRYIQQFIPRGSRVLDLGCGSGLISVALHDLGYGVVGCDVSEAMLRRAAETVLPRSIEFRMGNGFDIPAKDGEFDAVISRMFMAHFPDWPCILREQARVIHAGGYVMFDFGNQEHLANFPPDPEFPYACDVCSAGNFYAVASEKEIHEAAGACCLDVVKIIPHGLLLYNADFHRAVGRSGVDEFNAGLDVLLQHEKARELLVYIEESFVSRLSKGMTYGNLVVLRRNADTLS